MSNDEWMFAQLITGLISFDESSHVIKIKIDGSLRIWIQFCLYIFGSSFYFYTIRSKIFIKILKEEMLFPPFADDRESISIVIFPE